MTTRNTLWRTTLAVALALILLPSAFAQSARSDKPASAAESRVEPTGSASTFLGTAGQDASRPPAPSLDYLVDLLNEGFTSATFPPTGWNRFKDDANTSLSSDWNRSTSAPCSAANPCARSSFITPAPATRRFIATPAVTPTAGAILTFRAAQSFTDPYGSELKVFVSTDVSAVPNPATYTTLLLTLTEAQLPIGSFGNYSIDLSAYSGIPIRIAFVHEQFDGDALRLDDVIVASPTPAAYASSAFAFQNTATLGQGQEAWVAAANVVVSGNSGTTPLTSITFTTTGTTDLADLAGARVLYSGSNTSFNYQTTPEFGTPIVNPSGTLTFTGTQALTAGNNYFILVYAASSSVTANNLADATFESVTVDATVRTPSPTTLTGALRLIVPPSNDNLANAQKIYSTLLGVSQSTLGASLETDEVRNAGTCAASDGTGSIWYSYTPGTDGPATFDLSASTNAGSTTPGSFDTVLSVWTGSAHPLTSLGCDDDAGADVTSLLTVDVTGGTTYYVRITGYGASIGTAVMNITGPAPVQTFTSVAPAAGAVIRTGVETILRWTNPTPAPRDVRVLVRRGTGQFSSIFVGRNRGYLRYTFPTGTAPNVDYQYLVIDAGDASSFGTSPLFTVTDPAQAFVFTSPAPGTKWARGTTRTVTWTIPAGAVGGDVLFETFYKRRVLGLPTETELVSSFTTANDGTETIVIPAMAELGTYVYKVTKIGNAAFFGAGGVRIVITEVTAPVAGQTVNAGDPLTVTWIAASADPAAFVRIRLRSATQPTVVISPPAGLTNTGTASVTIPAGTVSGSDYFVQVQVQVAGVFANGSSKTFTIVGAGPRPVASTEHFVAPVGAGTDMAELVVSTPGLADGAEVAAFSGHLLVGSARVAGGMATMTVRGTVADMAFVAEGLTVEEALTTMEDGTVLSLRTWSATAGETVLEAGRVSDADGNEVDALTFVDGQDLTVAAKGAGTEGATAFALAGVSPNPMSSAGTVRFTMPDAQAVSVVVYDLLGRRVTTLFEGMAQAGANEVAVAARSLNAGVYVVRVSGVGVSATQRFTVVR